jgi:hypothetical protein
MRCLEEQADRRPTSAHELAKLLAACGVPTWTEDDAARAWRADEEALRTVMPLTASNGATPWGDTLAVDLDKRGVMIDAIAAKAAGGQRPIA